MIRVFRKIIVYYFHLTFKNFITKSNSKFFICDIDNSIANTWPQWNDKSIDSKTFYKIVPPLTKNINFVREHCSKNKLQIIFISARPFNQILNTRNWLKKYFEFPLPVFIVKNASDKLWYYETLIRHNKDFEVFDDLSYNHEKGMVRYHHDLIDYLRKNNIKYYDYSFITKINEETT